MHRNTELPPGANLTDGAGKPTFFSENDSTFEVDLLLRVARHPERIM